MRWALQLIVGLAVVVGGVWLAVGGDSDGSSGSGGGGSTQSASATPGSDSTPESSLATIPQSRLPTQGQRMLDLIRSEGPFPDDRDGVTFHNREGILPSQERGYYREYTVPTPGEDGRGARRIVGGEGGDRYWTEDHYASFRQIQEGR
ncbi:ribonuclease domain-containing protein [Janibacter sp. GS2]|uniref:ribonuclease domain-containing protein n=1 Tax=Janibacter sp. GS2 TaxID=3442646 RepID=UPI003EB7CE16